MRLQQHHFSSTSTASAQTVPLSPSYANSNIQNGPDSCRSTNSSSNGSSSTSSTSGVIVYPSTSSTQADSSSFLVLSTASNNKKSNKSTNPHRFSMFNMNSATVSTLQRLQQQPTGTPTQRSTVYRLSFNESSSTNGEPPLITPTYESIDVQNLVNAHPGYHQDPTSATAVGVYAESSQGTSDGGPDGSTGCMSDNPTVTIPDNHRLYSGATSHHYYGSRSASSIMPMSGIMAPMSLDAHHHHYPPSGTSGGYLTRSLHYYYQPDPNCYYGTTENSPTRTSPPLYSGISSPSIRPLPIKDEDFDIFNAIFALISLMSHCCCSGSTLILAYFLWRHEQDFVLFWMTIAATIVPSIIVNIISLKWLLTDNHWQQQQNNNNNSANSTTNGTTFFIRRPEIGPCGWMFSILLHIILLGPILRYINLLRYGVKSWSDKRRRVDQQQSKDGRGWSSIALPSLSTTLPRPRFQNSSGPGGLPNFEPAVKSTKKAYDQRIDYYMLTVAEDRDTSLLSLFQCLMQCTIQMVLHLHSLLCHWYFEHHHHLSDYNHNYTEYVQITVIGLALFETSWSISSYHRALRRASYDKRNLSAIGTILQSLWHAMTLSSRILAISLFLHQFGYWLLPIGIGHWGVMTIWIMHQGTHFFDSDLGHPNLCSEYMFNMLIGLIYLFVFINLKDEPTRYKYLSFYMVTLVENFSFATLWFLRVETDYWWQMRLPLFLAVPVLFASSVLIMQLYYWFVHPNGRPLVVNKAARCC